MCFIAAMNRPTSFWIYDTSLPELTAAPGWRLKCDTGVIGEVVVGGPFETAR